jgi:hypothetical protein
LTPVSVVNLDLPGAGLEDCLSCFDGFIDFSLAEGSRPVLRSAPLTTKAVELPEGRFAGLFDEGFGELS